MQMKKDHPNETEQERIKREKLNKYNNERLKNAAWYCDICKNGKNYTYRGKGMHIKTTKHNRMNTVFTDNLVQL